MQTEDCLKCFYNTQGTNSTNDDTYSGISWSTANGLKRYLYNCERYTSVVYTSDLWNGNNIEEGDPFFFDKLPLGGLDGDPYYNQSMIVTSIKNGWDFRYSAHCSNRKNRTIHHTTTPYSFWNDDQWTRGFHIEKLNNGSKLTGLQLFFIQQNMKRLSGKQESLFLY